MKDSENQKQRFDVFISHSFADKDVASQIARECTQRGLKAWLADYDLSPGEDAHSKIKEAIEMSRYLVVLVSDSSNAQNPWLSFEWSAIQRAAWESPKHTIVPVQLGEAELPTFLKAWQSVTLDPNTVRSSNSTGVPDMISSGVTGPKTDPEASLQTSKRFDILSSWISGSSSSSSGAE